MAKKLALELDVSMDELLSEEDVNDIQANMECGNQRGYKIGFTCKNSVKNY